jgi:ribonuclease BN (tRNA processing enzyme)
MPDRQQDLAISHHGTAEEAAKIVKQQGMIDRLMRTILLQ